MDEKKQDMIQKILKLLELGDADKNSNPHERELAQKKAAQMMAEHSLSFADLREGKPKSDIYTRIDIDGSEETRVPWEGILANGVGKTFDCFVVSCGGSRSDSSPWQLAFLGAKTDIEIAVFFFKYLRRTVGVMSERTVKGARAQDSYATGTVATILNRLDDLYKKKEEFIPADCKALIVVKKNDVRDFVKKEFPSLVQIKNNTRMDDNYHKGRADGHRINLSRPIGHDSTQSAGFIS